MLQRRSHKRSTTDDTSPASIPEKDQMYDYNTMDRTDIPPIASSSSPNSTNTAPTASIDDAINKIGTGRFQLQVLFAAGTCFMADSMEIILLSFLVIVLRDEWDWGDDDNVDGKLATVAAVMFIGALLGTCVLGPMGDRVGRKPVLFLAALIISVGGLVTGLCSNYISLVLVRFVVGFGIGGLTVPFDILTEFLPTEDRGRFLMYIEYFWTAGSMLVPIIAYVTLEIFGSWRVFVIVCAIPCVFSLVSSHWFVPESPRWLVAKGRGDEAMDILRNAAIVNGKDPAVLFPPGFKIQGEIVEETSDYTELFKPRWRKITTLLAGVWTGFSLGYYGTIMVVTKIFDENNGNGEDGKAFDYSAIFISSSAELIGTVLVIYFIDKIGRIPMQVASYVVGGLSLFLLCYLFGNVGRSALVALSFIARTVEMCGTSVTWISTAEIFSTEIRSTGHSATNAIARIGGFASPYLVSGGLSFKQIGAIMLLSHLITAFCASRLPETKGKELGNLSEEDSDTESLYQANETELI